MKKRLHLHHDFRIGYIMQRSENKLLRKGLIALFICFGLSAKAQTEFEIEEPHIENDNKLYFQDIVAEYGSYSTTALNSDMSEGYITSLYSGYFLTHWYGFRSGASLIMDLKHNSPYIKIPCLFAVRTPSLRLLIAEPESFREFLLSIFLLIIPTRFELNVGPSLGYVWNNQRSFASSIDANLRMGFQIWRIEIHGNMGVNYLWTKNFIDRDYDRDYKRLFRPAWFINLSFGASFRF
jgi:hypothetical protein